MLATTENINYDEIVKKSNYKFNLPIEELINNSKATQREKRNKKQVIPRPPNAYMIYRRNKAESPDIKSSDSGPEFFCLIMNKKIKILGLCKKVANTYHVNHVTKRIIII
ncbi:hypothetical protein RhiirA5_396370 [Rhizophagus irregularis]|uniref:Uncharacterized protein n=1 Tax=Rhizophagus irregularis TaxID=588596 RepID=A0A2N0Q2C3_9GLOM|nr:hypothetical protein RhiirA5_396370 [Rhizophagus irregularis]